MLPTPEGRRAPTAGRKTRNRQPWLAVIALTLFLTVGCAGAMPVEETWEEAPAAEEPTQEAAAPEAIEPTAAAIAPPTDTPLPTAPIPSPTPIIVEAAVEEPAGEVLGQLEVEYPVEMAPQASDTVILELSIPELLVAAEPAGVVRVEEAEPVAEGLGRYSAVVYLVARMRAELTSPALVVDPLSPTEQDVALLETDNPTTWAWTVRAPETAGKQVMTLRLFAAGDDAPLWIGSLRVDIATPQTMVSRLSEDAETLPEAAAAEAASATEAEQPRADTGAGLLAGVIEALTEDVTGLILGILSLVGSIIAAVLAAWVERGGSLKRNRKPPSHRRIVSHTGTGFGATLRALWFRLSERLRSRRH